MITPSSYNATKAKTKLRFLVSQMPDQKQSGSKRDLLLNEFENEWVTESTSKSSSLVSDLSDQAIFAEFERSLRFGLEESLHSSIFYTSSSILPDTSSEEDDTLVELSEDDSTDNLDEDMDYRGSSNEDPLFTSKSLKNNSNHTAATVDMNTSMRLSDVFDGETSSVDSQESFHDVVKSNSGKRPRCRQSSSLANFIVVTAKWFPERMNDEQKKRFILYNPLKILIVKNHYVSLSCSIYSIWSALCWNVVSKKPCSHSLKRFLNFKFACYFLQTRVWAAGSKENRATRAIISGKSWKSFVASNSWRDSASSHRLLQEA